MEMDRRERSERRYTAIFRHSRGRKAFVLISLLLISRAYLSPQRASYTRDCRTGYHHQIPPQIIISHARPITTERHPGFSKAVFSKSGNRLLYCGFMANVPLFLPLLYIPLTPIFVAGSGKSVLWYVISCYRCLHFQTVAQLWHNRGHHGPMRSRISNCSIFLLRLPR